MTDSRHHKQEGNNKNMAKSKGREILTIETLKTFYCFIEKK